MSERATEREMPRAKDMIDHVDDIGRRLASGELDPKDAGGSLRYIAGKLDTIRAASTDAPEGPSEVEKLLIGWEHAYPESIFPPPPEQPRKGAKLVWVAPEDGPGAIRELSEPFTIDSVSAAMGRSMAKALRRAFDADRAPTDEAPEGERLLLQLDEILAQARGALDRGELDAASAGIEWAQERVKRRLRQPEPARDGGGEPDV